MLPLGMCWQLQDGPDYHLSWGRGQGRLRRCGGVLWAFKRRKCVEIAKRALLAHLGLEHAPRGEGLNKVMQGPASPPRPAVR